MREELFGKTEKRQVSVTGQILIENVAARAAKLTKAASDFHKNIHLYVSKNGKVIDKHAEPNPHFTSICDLTWSQGRRVVGFNLIYDYTMITGLNGVGSALKKETQLEYEFDVKEPDTLKQIVLDLEDGDITSSLEYLEKTRPPEEEALRKSLQTQMITDCIESGLPSYDRTVRHLRKYKSPFTEDKERAKRLVGALLLGKASKNDVRYRNLFDNTSRSTISKKMTSFFVPYEAPLKNLLKYGYRNVARIAELSNLNYGTNTCIVPNELPIGSYINVNHSAFACPILKEQCTFSNPPMRLICGHVVSRDAITRLTSTHRSSRNGARHSRHLRFKCPYCPRDQYIENARLVVFQRWRDVDCSQEEVELFQFLE
uniref:RING-Gid-type domain-containing protein n=1 Tax=Caenorhabditis tropicalis TaxID=1561998 RepID=A0A1I7TCM1_9PELO